MALVSISTAKTHLNVTTSDKDGDIAMKVEQASDIIIDYLKSASAHRVATITTSSVASPTVITTSTAHGYSNGETVVIAGHEDSTPALLGSYVVSNVTEFSYTVPVAVTVAGAGGTGTVAWTEATTPPRVKACVLEMLASLYEDRGDGNGDAETWARIERTLKRSRHPAFA